MGFDLRQAELLWVRNAGRIWKYSGRVPQGCTKPCETDQLKPFKKIPKKLLSDLNFQLSAVTLHVLNVWQTCDWYYQVFGLAADVTPDGTTARLKVADRLLTFTAHEVLEEAFGPRRLHSFLSGPPAFHFDITTADVPALFAHALAHGAVAVRLPETSPVGQCVATLRDLSGLLIRLLENEPWVASAY